MNGAGRRLANFLRRFTQALLHLSAGSCRQLGDAPGAPPSIGGEVSDQALSTSRHGALLRRSLARAALYSSLVAATIVTLAIGPALVRNGPTFADLGAHPPHAPDLAPILAASPAIQVHLATVLAALALTAVLLAGVKGTRLHRTLGWAWSLFMLATALSTFFIRAAPVGPSFLGFGFLHLFAVLTLVSVPRAVLAARRHDVARHARVISGFVVGALGIAGVLAFLPGRLLWAVFFG